jgi:acetyltransferase-like isoleucine patch superfamily enzyme
VSFAPHSCAGGNVGVDDCSAVSLGANIIHAIRIGAHTVVGAGATVLKDLPDHVVAYGTPARVVRSREAGERYL